MIDEKDTCTSDEHMYNEASERLVEHLPDLGGHHYTPRPMLCRGVCRTYQNALTYSSFP